MCITGPNHKKTKTKAGGAASSGASSKPKRKMKAWANANTNAIALASDAHKLVSEEVKLADRVLRTAHKRAARKSQHAHVRGMVPSLAQIQQLRQTAMYHERFIENDAPFGWPAPLPINSVASTQRYAFVRGESAPVVYSLAAGETALITTLPTARQYPVRIYSSSASSTAGVPCTATAWDDQAGRTDATNATAATGDWAVNDPYVALADSDSLSGTRYMTTPTAADDTQPPAVQVLYNRVDVEVAAPYNGMGVVYAVSPGDAPSRMGHGRNTSALDSGANGIVNTTVRRRQAHLDEPLMSLISRVESSTSPLGVCQQLAEPAIVAGNNVHRVRVRGTPMQGWMASGELSTVDAANGNVTSATYGHAPRDNFVFAAQFGMVAVTNTGSTTLTIVATAHVVAAQSFQDDNGARAFGQIVGIMRNQMPQLGQRHPECVRVPPSTKVVNRPLPRADRGTGNAVSTHGLFHAVEQAGEGAAVGVGLASIVDSLKSWWPAIKSIAVDAGKTVGEMLL